MKKVRRQGSTNSRRPPHGSDHQEADDVSITSVDQVTAVIRQAIVSGRYGPGERIKIAQIAHRFGLSAMPVREALRKLEGEGILKITPNRGATVQAVDRRFIEEIFEVRTNLEIMIVSRCIESLTYDKLAGLEKLRAAHERATKSGDIEEVLDTSREFHIALFRHGGNSEALRLFERGWDIIHALRLRFGYSRERLETTIMEYRQLLDALRRMDAVEVRAIIHMHNRAGMEELLAKFCDQGDDL